jgi:streptogramin lyase
MKIFYHATARDNLVNIISNGIKAGCDGCVYMTEKEDEAVRFVAIRGVPEIVTFKIKVYKKDMDKVQETFDHSQVFFKCRSFGYYGDISPDNIEPLNIWDNPLVKGKN